MDVALGMYKMHTTRYCIKALQCLLFLKKDSAHHLSFTSNSSFVGLGSSPPMAAIKWPFYTQYFG
jgi:hypothetical protein